MNKPAHIQPVVFSSRNHKRPVKISQRGYFWIRYGLGAALITAIYFWTK